MNDGLVEAVTFGFFILAIGFLLQLILIINVIYKTLLSKDEILARIFLGTVFWLTILLAFIIYFNL